MRHHDPSEEALELAVLYALGALDSEQAAAFETHLAEGCHTCEAEVRAVVAAAGLLGHAAPQEPPAPEVRSGLFARLRADWTVVRTTEGRWEAAGSGMTIRRLFRDVATGRLTALGRLEPGTTEWGDCHVDMEELYLLEGDLTVGSEAMRAGDFCAAPETTIHPAIASHGGCMFLLHGSERDRLHPESPQEGRPDPALVRADEGTWRATGDAGVTWKILAVHPARATVTALVRMAPGARLRGHRHVTPEQFYMLEGDAHVTGYVLKAGDYYRAPGGTQHEVTHTEDGCLFLMIASRVEPLE